MLYVAPDLKQTLFLVHRAAPKAIVFSREAPSDGKSTRGEGCRRLTSWKSKPSMVAKHEVYQRDA